MVNLPDPKFDRLGITLEKEHRTLGEQLEEMEYAEEYGFDSIWVTESRLSRDAISILGRLSDRTDDLDLCTGVLPIWTRNVALMAQTWSTLYELSGPRFRCGLGAWWDPLASKVGVDRQRPNSLRATWEYSTALRRLLDLENVTYDGEYVSLEDVELSVVRSQADPEPRDVPLYVGATGMQMNTMVGELVGQGVLEGCVLNANLPTNYIEDCVERLERGVEREGGSIEDVDRPQYVYVSMDEDADVAIDKARKVCTQYLGTTAYIPDAVSSIVSDDIVEEVQREVGEWPVTDEALERAGELVPDEYVRAVTASGTPEQCVQRVAEYCEAGCTEPSLFVLSDNQLEVMETFSEFVTG